MEPFLRRDVKCTRHRFDGTGLFCAVRQRDLIRRDRQMINQATVIFTDDNQETAGVRIDDIRFRPLLSVMYGAACDMGDGIRCLVSP